MRQFREGGYNTLVSTCVGEEGLDIGDVDLIVCFDAHKSPIRLVQRMGRTGRKRKGRIIMLLTEGREEQVRCIVGRNRSGALWEGTGQVHCGKEQVRCIVRRNRSGALWEGTGQVHCGKEQVRCIVGRNRSGALWEANDNRFSLCRVVKFDLSKSGCKDKICAFLK